MTSVFLAVALYALWSSVFTLGKLALETSPPLFLTGFRMVFAALLVLPYLWIKNRSSFSFSSKNLLAILLMSIFSIYLTNICEYWGLQYLSSTKACFIYSLSPFFSAVFSYIHFKERLTIKKIIGIGIGILSCIPVLYIQSGQENLFHFIGIVSWPELAIIGATLFSVYGWILLRMLVKNQAMAPSLVNALSMLIGGTMAFIHSYFVENWDPTPVTRTDFLPFLGSVSLITLVSNIICYNLYGLLLRKFTATLLSFLGLLSPIFSSIYAWIFYHTPPSPLLLGSTLLIAGGLWMVYSAELKQGYILSKTPSN